MCIRDSANQLSDVERLARADDVIDNSGSMENLRSRVIALHQQWSAIYPAS